MRKCYFHFYWSIIIPEVSLPQWKVGGPVILCVCLAQHGTQGCSCLCYWERPGFKKLGCIHSIIWQLSVYTKLPPKQRLQLFWKHYLQCTICCQHLPAPQKTHDLNHSLWDFREDSWRSSTQALKALPSKRKILVKIKLEPAGKSFCVKVLTGFKIWRICPRWCSLHTHQWPSCSLTGQLVL